MTKKEFRTKLVEFFDKNEIDFDNSSSTKTLWNWSVKNHDVLNNTDLTPELFEETFAPTPEPTEPPEPPAPEPPAPASEEPETPVIEFKPKARGKKPKEETFTPSEQVLHTENQPTPKPEEKDNMIIWLLVALAALIMYFFIKNRNTQENEEK